MADVDFDDFDDGYGTAEGQGLRQQRVARLVNLAGALSSVALVAGFAIWGYKLAVRDVTGIPVIRALDGPMRIAPENPGGEVAAHQGLAVNDVAAIGTAAPPPETLILAPRPVELAAEDESSEDLAGAAPAQDTALAPVLAPAVAPVVAAPAGTAPANGAETGADADAVARALAEAMAGEDDLGAVEELAPSETLAPSEPVAPADQMAPETRMATAEPSQTAAPRPRLRPATLAPANAPATDAPAADAPTLGAEPAPPPVTEIDAANIPVGTRLVQLGAFDTADQARAEWVKLVNQFGPAFDGKALVVQQAESGGRAFFRLRAHGFADGTEARSFCTTLLQQNASCIPVEQR